MAFGSSAGLGAFGYYFFPVRMESNLDKETSLQNVPVAYQNCAILVSFMDKGGWTIPVVCLDTRSLWTNAKVLS
jgi:hypothetical protein